jgi:hypothetical protein
MPPGAGVTTWWPRLQSKRELWRLGSGRDRSFSAGFGFSIVVGWHAKTSPIARRCSLELMAKKIVQVRVTSAASLR